jgi:hypothetical protein
MSIQCYFTLRDSLVGLFDDHRKTTGNGMSKQAKAILSKAITGRVARPFGAHGSTPTIANFEGMNLRNPPLLGEFVEWFKAKFPNVPTDAEMPNDGKKAGPKKTKPVRDEPSHSEDEAESSQDEPMQAAPQPKRAPRRRLRVASPSASEEESSDDDKMHAAATSQKKKEVPPPKAAAPSPETMLREIMQSGKESILQQLFAEMQKTASAIKEDTANHLQAQAQSTKAEIVHTANQVGRITLDTLNEHTRDGASKLTSAYGALEQARAFAMYAEQIKRQQEERAALIDEQKRKEEAARLALEQEYRVMLLEKEAARKAIALERQAFEATAHLKEQAFGAAAHAEFERLRLEKEEAQRAKEDAIRDATAREEEANAKIEARAAELIRKLRIENTPQDPPPPPPPAQVNIRLQSAPQPVTEDVVARILARERDLLAATPTNVTPVKKRTLDETDAPNTSHKRKRHDDDDTPSKRGSFLKDVIDGVSVVTRLVIGAPKKPKAESGM